MKCDQCGSSMVNVGREIKPGRSEIWCDGYVCQTPRCSGYGVQFHDGSASRWPAMTLMGVGIHLCISGALKFRDRMVR